MHENFTMKHLFLAGLAVFTVTSPAFADLALATTKNCMTCHTIDKKVVGPAFKDVAPKYAAQKNVADMLATKIIQGGSSAWGPVPMPANAQVSPADAKKLANWILTLK